MSKTQANVIIALLAVVLVAVIGLQWRGLGAAPLASGPASQDRREAVGLSAVQREFSLGQMRSLLVTLNEYDRAAAATDFARLAALAKEQGPAAGRNAPAGLHEAQPETFRALSRTMRRSFAAMEQAAHRHDLTGVRAARQAVGEACVACHESYRFELTGSK